MWRSQVDWSLMVLSSAAPLGQVIAINDEDNLVMK